MQTLSEQLEVALSTNQLVEVKFTKVDGTIRTMVCTKSALMIPEASLPKPKAENEVAKKANDSIISVYDIEVKNWRSFRKENILEFTVKEAEPIQWQTVAEI